MYSKIINPKTGREVNINGKIGKEILRNYLNVLSGGSSPYNISCRNKLKPDKLNKKGHKEYNEYKNICPDNKGLTWDRNICNSRNNHTAKNYAKYATGYEECAYERDDFNKKCIINTDDGHKHAIKKMKNFAKECKKIGRRLYHSKFDQIYNGVNSSAVKKKKKKPVNKKSSAVKDITQGLRISR